MNKIAVFLLCLFPIFAFGQISMDFNAWADVELSQGDSTSHYFYNEIHANHKDWRAGISGVNLLLKTKLTSSLSINLRGQLSRDKGAELKKINLPLANIQYAPKDKNWSITAGRFIVPFGVFAEKQHSKERTFINLPLAFSYYNNISPKVGFAENMGEDKFKINDEVQWGSTTQYYGAYTNGLRFDWGLIPDKVDWTIALTNAAPNILSEPFDFTNWGLVTKLKFQPKYFWEQHVSFSYGSFMQPIAEDFLSTTDFQQMLLSTDFVLGFGFWEFSGQVLAGNYKTYQYNPSELTFTPFTDEFKFSTLNTSLNVKYELPFLSGMYAAYGIDYLAFGKSPDNVESPKWDDAVLRHNVGLGYKINNFLLFRTNYMIQSVENHPVWAQNTWRTTLTIFY